MGIINAIEFLGGCLLWHLTRLDESVARVKRKAIGILELLEVLAEKLKPLDAIVLQPILY